MREAALFLRTTCVAAVAVMGMMSAPARAQDQDAENTDAAAPEIIVTAQFREQRLQDVPLAITALSGDMLEQRGQISIADIAGSAPNVNLRQASSNFGPAVVAYIRGVGQRDTSFALEPGVGIYVDDVYLSTLQGSMLNLIDLDRLEILRGPQGTLAGQNSIGGAVRLYSRKPGPSQDAFMSATYGSFNRMELRAATNVTLAENALWARLSGAAVKRDGYVTRYDYRCTHPGSTVPSSTTGDSCKLGTEGGKEYVAGRVALRWEPVSKVTVDLVGDITRDSSEVGPATLLYVGRNAVPGAMLTGIATPAAPHYLLNGNVLGTSTGSPFVSYSPFGDFAQDGFTTSPYVSYENYLEAAPRDGSGGWAPPLRNSMNNWGLSATVNAELTDNLAITSITGYREFSGQYSSGDASPFNTSLQANRVWNQQFSQELRLAARFGDLADLTLGGFYFDKTSRNRSRITLTTLNFMEDNSSPSTTKAVFGNVELRPLDGLTLLGGLRYTDQSKEFVFGREGIPGSSTNGAVPPSLAALNGLVGEFNGSMLDYRVGAQYRFSPEIMGYAQVSTGFKGGGVNPRPFFPAQVIAHEPEKLTAYEIGLKTDLFDRRARINLSAFLNKYDDILVTVANCPLVTGVPAAPCALPLNAGQADVKGIEAEFNLRPVQGLTLDASIAYLHFKYTSISALAASAGVGLEDKGVFVSPWQWSIGAQYEIELGDSGTLTPRIDVNYQDSMNRNANNVDAATGGKDIFGLIRGYTLANARLAYATPDREWEVAAEVRNLTDKLYYNDVFDNRPSTNTVVASPGEPRTWAMTVKRRF